MGSEMCIRDRNTEGMSRETVTRTPEPLDTEDVTLYLFAIDGIMIH